jgi:MFS family permease
MKNQKILIPLFYIVTALYWFSLYTYVPTLSPYVKSLGASYKLVGIIIGSYGFTQMLLRIPLGILSDKLKMRKPFVSLGVFLGMFSCLGMLFFHEPVWVLVFRSMAGAAAATWVTYTVLFSSYFSEEEMPKSIGMINSYCSLGQVLAMLIGGAAAQYFTQFTPFLVGAVGGLAGLFISFFIKEDKHVDREPQKIRELLTVGKERGLLIPSGLAIICQLITFGTVFGFTPVAAKAIGATSFQLGLLTALSTLPGIFSAAMSGSVFAKRWGEKRTITYGFLLVALSCLAIPYAKSLWVLYLTQMIGGFGQGAVFPLLMSASIKSVSIQKRATAMGFFQAIYGIGMFIGPVMVGFLSDSVGLIYGFWAISLIGLAGALLTHLLMKQRNVVNKEKIA